MQTRIEIPYTLWSITRVENDTLVTHLTAQVQLAITDNMVRCCTLCPEDCGYKNRQKLPKVPGCCASGAECTQACARTAGREPGEGMKETCADFLEQAEP